MSLQAKAPRRRNASPEQTGSTKPVPGPRQQVVGLRRIAGVQRKLDAPGEMPEMLESERLARLAREIDIECTFGGTGTSLTIGDGGVDPVAGFQGGDDRVEILLGVGGTVDCTFTNRQRGKIVIDKVVDSMRADAGDEDFTFVLSWDDTDLMLSGDAPVHESAFLAADGTAYTVSENANAGWEQTSATCTSDSREGDIAPDAIDLQSAHHGNDAVRARVLCLTGVDRRLEPGIAGAREHRGETLDGALA